MKKEKDKERFEDGRDELIGGGRGATKKEAINYLPYILIAVAVIGVTLLIIL